MLCVLTVAAAEPPPPPTMDVLALMDFSTDENSYRAMQAAANLTSLVQTKLGGIPRVEWVERSQIRLPQAELALAEALGAGGASALRRGRMLGANWLVQGQLSTDGDDRPAVALEVVDLAHADVLAASTTPLPATVAGKPPVDDAVEAVAAALRQLLATARHKSADAAQARDELTTNLTGEEFQRAPDTVEALLKMDRGDAFPLTENALVTSCKILNQERHLSVAVDLAEQTAAKTALQNAAAELADRIAAKLAK